MKCIMNLMLMVLATSGLLVSRPSAGASQADCSPLFSAISREDIGEIEKLLAKGADPNDGCDPKKGTPFTVALVEERYQVADFLLAHGADPNFQLTVPDGAREEIKRYGHMSLLHAVAGDGPKGLAEWLLSHGANPNLEAGNGATPLHLAVAFDNTEVAEVLLDHCVDPTIRDNQGKSALDLAVEKGSELEPAIRRSMKKCP